MNIATKKMNITTNSGRVFTFDEIKHRFTDESGTKIPSVSEIVNIIDKSGVLINWAVKKYSEYLEANCNSGMSMTDLILRGKSEWRRVRDEAADIGTAVHSWIEEYFKGNIGEIPDDEKMSNGIQAFLKWIKLEKPMCLKSEQKVISEQYKYGGIFDLILEINGKKILIDIKTGSGIYPEMALQLTGYQLAYEEMTGERIDGLAIIHLNKHTGEFTFQEMEKEEVSFLAAKQLNDFVNYGDKIKNKPTK